MDTLRVLWHVNLVVFPSQCCQLCWWHGDSPGQAVHGGASPCHSFSLIKELSVVKVRCTRWMAEYLNVARYYNRAYRLMRHELQRTYIFVDIWCQMHQSS